VSLYNINHDPISSISLYPCGLTSIRIWNKILFVSIHRWPSCLLFCGGFGDLFDGWLVAAVYLQWTNCEDAAVQSPITILQTIDDPDSYWKHVSAQLISLSGIVPYNHTPEIKLWFLNVNSALFPFMFVISQIFIKYQLVLIFLHKQIN